MKKLILAAIFLFVASLSINAQDVKENALGLRIGSNNGIGTEVSYQKGISSDNRLEFDLGWNSRDKINVIKLTGLYQWVFKLDGNLNWYVGAGPGIAFASFDDDFKGNPDNKAYVYAAGDIGLEYDFDIPLVLTVDFRPELGFADFNDDIDFDLSLGIRYQF